MKKIKVHNRVCFKLLSKKLTILDYRKIVFYTEKFLHDIDSVFSLPIGVYYLNGNIKKVHCKEPVLPILPKFERDLKHDFRKFKIEFDVNPHKASILHNERKIIFDNQYEKAPLYQLIFILMHEKGHNFYKTEEYADLYAVRAMLKAGFTKKQIALSPFLILSDKQIERKRLVINELMSEL